MTPQLIQYYIRLTDFLGQVLGPDYEVALYDISGSEGSIIAIANGSISGRTIGAPLTDKMQQLIDEGRFREQDYHINYSGVAARTGKMLRTSTLFLQDDSGALTGLLSISFDDSRYQELSDRLLKLRHPDAFVETNFVFNLEKAKKESAPPVDAESFHSSISVATENAIAQVLQEMDVPPERLTLDEKRRIVGILDTKGVFLLKGAVRDVAKQLRCSQATIYRYLGQLSKTAE